MNNFRANFVLFVLLFLLLFGCCRCCICFSSLIFFILSFLPSMALARSFSFSFSLSLVIWLYCVKQIEKCNAIELRKRISSYGRSVILEVGLWSHTLFIQLGFFFQFQVFLLLFLHFGLVLYVVDIFLGLALSFSLQCECTTFGVFSNFFFPDISFSLSFSHVFCSRREATFGQRILPRKNAIFIALRNVSSSPSYCRHIHYRRQDLFRNFWFRCFSPPLLQWLSSVPISIWWYKLADFLSLSHSLSLFLSRFLPHSI